LVPDNIFATPHFLLANEWVKQVRVLHYITLERLPRDKHTSLLCPYVSYKEMEVF